MRREVNKLKQHQLAKLSKVPGHHADGNGLYFEVRPVTLCTWWALRYKINGSQRSRYYSLGAWPRVGLAEARHLADGARSLLRQGRDPVAERGTHNGDMNFAQLVEKFKAESEIYKKLSDKSGWNATLAETIPTLGKMKPRAITAQHVWTALAPVCERAAETGSRLRGRLERVFDYAKALGLTDSENPAHLELHRDHMKPRNKGHQAALPWQAIPEFMQRLRAKKSASASALEFTILTGVRTGDTIGARWDEIDLATSTWTIPAARLKIKGKGDHRVPLSAAVLAILKAIPRRGELVFPLSNMAMLNLLKGMGEAVTVHGFRSSFRSWGAASTEYPEAVLDMALAHVISDKVRAAYQRDDLIQKRVSLMDDWARYCG